MDDSIIGASVNLQKGNRLLQHTGAICATLGAFGLGSSLGWTSPAVSAFEDGSYLGRVISSEEQSWIESLMPLGAAAISFPIGYFIDQFGRKRSMLGIYLFFIIGWSLIIWPNGVEMVYAGRFLTGMAGGAFPVAASCYATEIAEVEIRGTLGSYLELQGCAGILFVYIVGALVDLKVLSYICGALPIVFATAFFFMPESPVFLMTKNRVEEAKKSLKFFRGEKYDIDFEINEIRETIEKERGEKISLVEGFSTKAAKIGLVISLSLMIFQQLSGVNAVTFNTSQIFEGAGTDLSSDVSSIIMSAVQTSSVIVSAFVVDRLGRKYLLMFSVGVMSVCQLLLGVYFYLKDDKQDVSNIGWLPLVSLCFFMFAGEIGIGPVPWLLAVELFPPATRGFANSLACCVNWIFVFLVTRFFNNLKEAIGMGPAFWLFSGLLAVAFVFVIFVVKETKGKTIEEIQIMLEGGQ